MFKKLFLIALLASHPAFANSNSISTDIHDKNGAKIGHVVAAQDKNGVTFIISVAGLKPGLHGIHIHAVGKCDGPDFKSSGSHFAFSGQMHGMDNPKGPHLGDMPNLSVKPDGTGKLRFHTGLVTLKDGENSLRKPGGTSLVIHEGQDDQKSDPAGNSGNRIACAVLAQ